VDGVLAPVGRASLWVYIIHLPMVYGWSTWPGLAGVWGHSLEVVPALETALGVLAVSLALALPAKRLYSRWLSHRAGVRQPTEVAAPGAAEDRASRDVALAGFMGQPGEGGVPRLAAHEPDLPELADGKTDFSTR
jgi:hypothetical protein